MRCPAREKPNSMNLPKRLELSLRKVRALPKASRTGLEDAFEEAREDVEDLPFWSSHVTVFPPHVRTLEKHTPLEGGVTGACCSSAEEEADLTGDCCCLVGWSSAASSSSGLRSRTEPRRLLLEDV